MLHGIIRAATAALVFVIAILVYINYFHKSDSVLPERAELASAPEVPSVPISPDIEPEVATAPAAPSAPVAPPAPAAPAAAPAPETPPAPVAHAAPRAPVSKAPKAEILDSNNEIAEVVDLPPLQRSRSSAAVAEPAPKASGKRTHIVQPGESLWVISRKYLGNGELNGKIAVANGLTSRDHIRPGQVLVIPDLNASTPAVNREVIETASTSEDLADHEDVRRVSTVSRTSEPIRQPAMSSAVKNKF